jgi:hypothetical protein
MKVKTPIKTTFLYYDDVPDPIMPRIKTWDIIPYVFNKGGFPLYEDEGYTVDWVDRNLDYFGNKVTKSTGQESVFDQLSDNEIDIIIIRMNK